MDWEIKGKLRNFVGRVKSAFGSLSGSKRLEAEGMVDRAGGKVQSGIGRAANRAEQEIDERRSPNVPSSDPTLKRY
jgi:uncharacterized protein YjbJ (UPF0337 family)